jgi:hypothetical protein
MDDERLRHLCKLATIACGPLGNTPEAKQEFVDYIADCGDDRIEMEGYFTMLTVLADAFIELCKRQGMQPTFRVPAAVEEDA